MVTKGVWKFFAVVSGALSGSSSQWCLGHCLEVLRSGVWGTVCDDSFSNVDAQVACYMLGFG